MQNRQRSGAGGFPALLLLEPEHLLRAYKELETHPHPLFRWIIRPLIGLVLGQEEENGKNPFSPVLRRLRQQRDGKETT